MAESMLPPSWAGAPPRRVSARQDSPHWHPYWSFHARVLLGEQTLSHVIEADADEGWAEIYPQPMRIENDELVTIIVRGELKILPPEAPCP